MIDATYYAPYLNYCGYALQLWGIDGDHFMDAQGNIYLPVPFARMTNPSNAQHTGWILNKNAGEPMNVPPGITVTKMYPSMQWFAPMWERLFGEATPTGARGAHINPYYNLANKDSLRGLAAKLGLPQEEADTAALDFALENWQMYGQPYSEASHPAYIADIIAKAIFKKKGIDYAGLTGAQQQALQAKAQALQNAYERADESTDFTNVVGGIVQGYIDEFTKNPAKLLAPDAVVASDMAIAKEKEFERNPLQTTVKTAASYAVSAGVSEALSTGGGTVDELELGDLPLDNSLPIGEVDLSVPMDFQTPDDYGLGDPDTTDFSAPTELDNSLPEGVNTSFLNSLATKGLDVATKQLSAKSTSAPNKSNNSNADSKKASAGKTTAMNFLSKPSTSLNSASKSLAGFATVPVLAIMGFIFYILFLRK